MSDDVSEVMTFQCVQFLQGKLMPNMEPDAFLSSLMGLYKVDALSARRAMSHAMELEFNRDIGKQLIRSIA